MMKLVDIEAIAKITKANKVLLLLIILCNTVLAESIGFRCGYRDAFSNKIPCRTF
jgi:hypothetical protein